MRVVTILIGIEEPMMIEGSLKEDTKKGVEGHQMEEIIKIEDILEEEDPLIEVGGPSNNGGLPDNGGPPDDGRPPGNR